MKLSRQFGSRMQLVNGKGQKRGDSWEKFGDYVVRWHTQRRKGLFDPRSVPDAPKDSELTNNRFTIMSGQPWIIKDDWKIESNAQKVIKGDGWVGETIFWFSHPAEPPKPGNKKQRRSIKGKSKALRRPRDVAAVPAKVDIPGHMLELCAYQDSKICDPEQFGDMRLTRITHRMTCSARPA